MFLLKVFIDFPKHISKLELINKEKNGNQIFTLNGALFYLFDFTCHKYLTYL